MLKKVNSEALNMKQLGVIALSVLFSISAQSQNEILSKLRTDALIISDDGLLKEQVEVNNFVADFSDYSYKKDFNITVNSVLDYEIGEISVEKNSWSVMFLKRKDDGSKIELLVIYKKKKTKDHLSAIDQARKEWMKLCNAHNAGKLVKQLYTSDAYYYSRGGLIQGTESITTEYDYMNNPSYSLKLTPKHLIFVSSDIAFEIGQCSGSYPLPYMLLWQKQSEGNWQVLMDSNY